MPSPKVYDWGFFWENGQKFSLPVPFGPESPEEERMITSLDSIWVQNLALLYPNLYPVLESISDWGFAFILVNPPRDADKYEVEHFKSKGFTHEDW